MRKAFVIAMAALMSIGTMAQTNVSFDGGRTEKLKARYEMKKESMKRDAKKMDPKSLALPADGIYMPTTKAVKSADAKLSINQLPADRWFPGEWEEVQGIVVNFPYNSYPADHLGDEDYTADIYLPGRGALYHWVNNYVGFRYYGWGDVNGIPDTIDYLEYAEYYRSIGQLEYAEYYEKREDFRNVFLNLIDAIQHGTQAWITIWNLSDSTIVKDFMASKGMPLTNYRFIEAYANAFWYRDCGPICFYYGDNDEIGILNFLYGGIRAADDKLPDSIASQTGMPNYVSTLDWEGGNCLVDGYSKLFTSTATLEENRSSQGEMYETGNNMNPYAYRSKNPLSHAQVTDSMNAIFGETHFLPRFEYDGGTGHIDLYADMYDENRFVFSKFPSQYSNWTDAVTAAMNIDSLTSWQSFAGVNYTAAYIPFPSRDDGSNFPSQIVYDTMYTRSYSNHTFVNDIIVLPCFSKVVDGNPSADWDRANVDGVRAAYPGYTIYPIDVRSFDGYGGAIHCITKQIPAASPIRILHSPITGPQGDTYNTQNAVINARITNNTGIAQAQLKYRVNDGEWQTVNMTADGDNMFSAAIPTTTFSTEGVNVYYYISATSNGGKTITKPFTANNGAYFVFGTNGQLSIADANGAEENFGQFYPNPATEQASMVIDMLGGKSYKVNIYDLSGREVHSSSLQVQGTIVYSVNAARMASGQYTVVFTNGSERVVRKLVVK